MFKKMAGAVVAQSKVVKQVKAVSKSKLPPLEDFLAAADFVGAATLLEFELRTGDSDAATQEWLAYVSFHSGDYKRAGDIYGRLLTEAAAAAGGGAASGGPSSGSAPPGLLRLYRACCLFHMGRYGEAESEAAQGLDSPLRTRIQYHVAHKLGKEGALLAGHTALSKSGAGEDALCLAAMHVGRGHYQDAADVYKQLLLAKEHKDDAALHFYTALCFYKLDYYDVSLEVLASYMAGQPASPSAVNLKACAAFKIYHGRAGEAELKALTDLGVPLEASDLLRHNTVVFRGGEGAMSVLPPLVAGGGIPEARLNLAIHHLKSGNVEGAAGLLRNITPSTPQEYVLTAVVHTLLSQRAAPGSPAARESLKTAQQAYHLIGASPTDVDTVPGRCAMASYYHLTSSWDDVAVYLSSVKPYLSGEEAYGWNYGLALAAVGKYGEAEEVLVGLQSLGQGGAPAPCTGEPLYLLWLARCYIMNGKPGLAWELYLGGGGSGGGGGRGAGGATGAGGHLLHLIAADCYRTGAFLLSAKAYDVLERMEGARGGGDREVWEGKRGACAGAFGCMVVGREEGRDREALREVCAMLRNTVENGGGAAGPGAAAEAQKMVATITRWAQANGGI